MNRYDWLLWAFRLFFSGEIINQVKALVVSLEASQNKTGEAKRDFIEEAFKPILTDISVYLLRALIEVLLGQIRTAK